MDDHLKAAIEEARKSLAEGGIGSVMHFGMKILGCRPALNSKVIA